MAKKLRHFLIFTALDDERKVMLDLGSVKATTSSRGKAGFIL